LAVNCSLFSYLFFFPTFPLGLRAPLSFSVCVEDLFRFFHVAHSSGAPSTNAVRPALPNMSEAVPGGTPYSCPSGVVAPPVFSFSLLSLFLLLFLVLSRVSCASPVGVLPSLAFGSYFSSLNACGFFFRLCCPIFSSWFRLVWDF